MKTFRGKLALLVLAIIVSAATSWAQQVTAGITGLVSDRGKGVLPGAQVVARNLDTGVEYPATANSAGLYRIEFLPPGHYQMSVNMAGFKTATVPPFVLEALQTPTFNITMEVGSTSTTVNVTSASPILNTNDPTLGTTITASAIENQPLNGLDYAALTLYVPGTVSTYGTSGTTVIERSASNSAVFDSPNMNGNRSQSNNFILDGIDINETFGNFPSYNPAPEALEEVKVLTSNAPADYGNVSGGGIVAVLKSGTNQFHGSAYGYLQDSKTNANTWTNNHQTPIIPINPFTQTQFGGSIGGPILRNKLFFFVDFLGARFHQGGLGQASVFSAAMRNGDFSSLLSSSNPIQLYDSQNGFAPYVNNTGVPILNPVAQFLFAHPSLYPLPNATPSDGVTLNNLQGPVRSYRGNNQGDVKIEYDARLNDKITGFYSASTGYDGQTSVLPVTFPVTDHSPTNVFGVGWVHTFSPALINMARVGFTRTNLPPSTPTDPSGQFGLSGNTKVGIPFGAQPSLGFSLQGFGATAGFGGSGSSINLTNVGTEGLGPAVVDNTYSYTDNVGWQRGLHLLSIGIQALRYQNNFSPTNNYQPLGALQYSGAFTGNPALANAGGYPGADFVLDRVYGLGISLASIRVGQRQWRAAGFVQDDWKILPNLTLNLGLRYEYDQPWIEQNNKNANVDLTTQTLIYAGHVPAGAPAGSGVCSNSGCYQPNYRQIMPRFGFAYQTASRVVIRGGYGATSYFEGNSYNQRLSANPPFLQAVSLTTITPTAASAGTPANGGSPRTVQQGFSTSSTNSSGPATQIWPHNMQPAYIQEWNLTGEYAFTPSLGLQIGYIGEQGQHIEDYGNLNQYRVNGDPTSAPFYNSANLGLGSNIVMITEARAMMNYNALQATLRQHLNRGLEFTLNYTYSKAMTNSLGMYFLNVNGYSGAFQNYYDSSADYGPAGYDVTHNVSGIGAYALPVGRGRTYLSHENRLVDAAIGGWKVSVSGVAYSGFPESITGPGNNSNSYGVSRANQYRKLKIAHRSIDNWLGTDASATPCTQPGVDNGICAFGAPASNAFGNSRNGVIRGPGYLNVDSSMFKDFHITEGQIVGFRFDAFNVFNIASYGNPDIGITDSTFGNISNQNPAVRSQERRLQFALRYSF